MLQCSGDFAEMPAMLQNLVLKNVLHENTYKIVCVHTTSGFFLHLKLMNEISSFILKTRIMLKCVVIN
jgi:hypothetical protein